jgi:amidase
MPDVAFRSATALARDLKAGRIGSLELLEHYMARNTRHNGVLNAIIATDFDEARKRARAADRARARGVSWEPLHGLPMTVKESFDVAGLPTTWGLAQFRDNRATAHSAAVQRLIDAGAIVFGKTNVPVLLAQWQTHNLAGPT